MVLLWLACAKLSDGLFLKIKGFVLRVAAIFHQRIKYKHMNHKKLLPAILAAFCLPVWADTPPPEPRTEP